MIACAATLGGVFLDYWWNDFRYFWVAGDIWNSGGSPYLPGYVERGQEISSTFDAPFYYPPAIRPFVSLLALVPMQQSAALFFGLNVSLLFFSCRILTSVTSIIAPKIDPNIAYCAFLLVTFVILRHPLIVAGIGQFTIIFLAAASAFIYGAATGRKGIIAIALAVLLIKPQLGLGLLFLSLLTPGVRRQAVAALTLYGVFTVIGLWNEPIASLAGFLENINSYTDHPVNAVNHSAGLSYILSLGGVELPSFVSVLLLGAGALAMPRIGTARDIGLSAITMLVWGLYVTPTHATDFTILAPAALLALFDRGMARWAIMCGVFLVLGRSTDLAIAIDLSRSDRLAAITIANTAALTTLLWLSLSANSLCALRSGAPRPATSQS